MIAHQSPTFTEFLDGLVIEEYSLFTSTSVQFSQRKQDATYSGAILSTSKCYIVGKTLARRKLIVPGLSHIGRKISELSRREHL